MNSKQSSSAHFGEVVGYERLPSESGTALLALKLRPEHCNRGGTVHGGVLMTLLDTAGMWASCAPGDVAVGATVSISCSFLAAVPVSKFDTLHARAEITRKGRTMYFASVTVHALLGEKLAATAQAVFAIPQAQAPAQNSRPG